jgi:hypothetical protein
MSQVTGPAAARLMGDVGGNVWEAAANYDAASIKLFQMAVAISGWRVQNGDWGTPSRQQEKFRPFNLESYQRGDLDLSITVRPLIPVTALEQVAIDRQKLLLEADRAAFGGDTSAIAQRLSAAAAQAAIRPGNPETGALGKA